MAKAKTPKHPDGISNVTNLSFTNTTSSVQPRLAINHTIDDNWSAYGQFSSGTNPMMAPQAPVCITSFRRFEARKHMEEDPHVCHVFSPIPNPGLFGVDEQMAKQMYQFVYERAREALARNSGAS